MFNSKHYVPILKWKGAEQGALKVLEEKHKKNITPLIQFVMPQQAPHDNLKSIVAKFEKKMHDFPEKIIEIWGRKPIFIDVSLLFTTQLKAKCLNNVSRGGHKLGGVFIPTIHLNDDEALIKVALSVAKETRSGLCVRLICSDFHDMDKLGHDITQLLATNSLTEGDVDLLVDIKEVGEGVRKCEKYLQLGQRIPALLKWRTFIFASGSFPEDLSRCRFDEENLIPRVGWRIWAEKIAGNTLKRKPTFADYTIQYPIYKESLQFFHPTTSIKYALGNDWLVLKGKKKQYGLYLANAKLLSNSKYYYGSDFSSGDRYIAEKSRHFDVYMKDKSVKGTGSTATWLAVGINHHLTLVAHQVAILT